MAASAIILPPLPQPRPRAYGGRRSLVRGLAAVLEPDGSVAWQDEDWQPNILHDAGEKSVGNVYLREQANPSKYLTALNDASIAETDGTMGAVVESGTPGTAGFARQQITAANWTDDGLVGGDNRFSAAEKTIGPVTSQHTATHAALCDGPTGTTPLLILTVALSATTVIAINQSLKLILLWTWS